MKVIAPDSVVRINGTTIDADGPDIVVTETEEGVEKALLYVFDDALTTEDGLITSVSATIRTLTPLDVYLQPKRTIQLDRGGHSVRATAWLLESFLCRDLFTSRLVMLSAWDVDEFEWA